MHSDQSLSVGDLLFVFVPEGRTNLAWVKRIEDSRIPRYSTNINGDWRQPRDLAFVEATMLACPSCGQSGHGTDATPTSLHHEGLMTSIL